MEACDRYLALKEWLVRCSVSEQAINRYDIRSDNLKLFEALQDLRALALSQEPEEISELFASVRESVLHAWQTRVQREPPETD